MQRPIGLNRKNTLIKAGGYDPSSSNLNQAKMSKPEAHLYPTIGNSTQSINKNELNKTDPGFVPPNTNQSLHPMGDQYIQMMAWKRYEDKVKMRRMREREKAERWNLTEAQLTQDSKIAKWENDDFADKVRRNDSEFLKEYNNDDVRSQIEAQKRLFDQN